jgi:hypothetical protein
MRKLIDVLGNIAAVIYFLVVMLLVIMFLIIAPILLIISIKDILVSGFSKEDLGMIYIVFPGLFIGISLFIPAFRRMYYKLPWLFPFVKILYLNDIILSIATMLLNYGYEVQDSARHTLFLFIMIGQIIICRVLMCIYFRKKKVQYIGGKTYER